MIKKGIVIEHDGKKGILMTSSGEFIKINTKGKIELGQEYVYKTNEYLSYNKLLIAASMVLFIFSTLFYNMYYTVYASVIVSINPKVKLEVNRFERIINVMPLNDDAKELIRDINLKNKKIEDGLMMVVEKAKEKKIITDEYKKGSSQAVEVTTEGKPLKLDSFYKEIENRGINIKTVEENVKIRKNNNKNNSDTTTKRLEEKYIEKNNLKNKKEIPSNKKREKIEFEEDRDKQKNMNKKHENKNSNKNNIKGKNN
ncbi:Anti-sigma-I factor RsgI [Caloramator mitchellensis]|uniref:Anti-sigma-I factor RsgI n=1 Tax=Caloramator mitchellensis TaxID=908809 RepID=A0A0R3JT74_CALMK|nr:anti-sigma factor domain-containing protein [Caloramator mitchellensis]KRQ86202.1 Anti-sigma-I factor RsgI [Caloramator mitchellensis]